MPADDDLPVFSAVPQQRAQAVRRFLAIDDATADLWEMRDLLSGSAPIAAAATAGRADGSVAIVGFSVDADLRGRGHATRLLAALSDALRQRGCPRVEAVVPVEDARLIVALHRVGFAARDVIRANTGQRLLRLEQPL